MGKYEDKITNIKGIAADNSAPVQRALAAWTSIEQTIVDALVDQVILLSASVEGLSLSGHSVWLRVYRTAGVMSHAELRRNHLANIESYLRAWAVRLKGRLPITVRSPGWRRNIIARIVRRAQALKSEQRLAAMLRTCHALTTEDLTDNQLEAVFSAVTDWTDKASSVA